MKTVLLLLCLGFSAYAGAQDDWEVSADGEEAIENAIAGLPKSRLAPHVPAYRFELPATESPEQLGSLLKQESLRAGFHPAGYVAPAPPGILERVRWTRLPNGGHVVAVELHSQDAKALRVRFSGKFHEDLQMMAYDPIGGYAFGPYNQPPLDEEGNWWTTLIFGDRIGLEFYLPREGAFPIRLPELTAIAYFYDDGSSLFGDFQPAGGCSFRDATCETRVAAETGAVTMLSVVSGTGLAGFCSGALLNRNPSDPGLNSPVVMTANHCVPAGVSAASTILVWRFKTSTCNGTPPDRNSLPRSNGTVVLKRKVSADWTLLGSLEPVAGTFFLGWDSAFWLSFSEATGLHHPAGTFMRVSEGHVTIPFIGIYCDQNGQNCFTADVWIVDYDTFGTQGGSSGSPVMDAQLQVRGTLTGGPNCTQAHYGRFDLAFSNLRFFLFEMANPTFVDHAFSGDSGNNGDTERGTSANPFNSVREGVYCVPTGGTVRIRPGNYNEKFTLFRAMTLQREGSTGIVQIGAP